MTPTNNQIYRGAIDILNNAALPYPVIYPGYTMTPPSTGMWLEVRFFPNKGIDSGLANDSTMIPQGIFQVECYDRPGSGTDNVQSLADQIRDLYAKGTVFSDRVRVIRAPYDMELEPEPSKLSIVVSVEYSG